uniref:HDC08876 n=1 Tax=Drosophila melanogaster TaxID=7227 RepID=Q6ILN3_DROME|nr:TPA_inf: HDC08876 [Drosophila melanogaster]
MGQSENHLHVSSAAACILGQPGEDEQKSSIWQGSWKRNHKPTPKHVNNTAPLERRKGKAHALIS